MRAHTNCLDTAGSFLVHLRYSLPRFTLKPETQPPAKKRQLEAINFDDVAKPRRWNFTGMIMMNVVVALVAVEKGLVFGYRRCKQIFAIKCNLVLVVAVRWGATTSLSS